MSGATDHDLCFVSLASYGYFEPDAYDLTGGGGAKRQMYLLTTALADRFDVAGVVGDYGQPRHERHDGIDLYRAYNPSDGTALPKKLYRLFEAMKAADADVYLYRGRPEMCVAVGVIATLLNAKFVYHVSNDADLRQHYQANPRPIRVLYRVMLRHADAIVSQTDKQQAMLERAFSVPSVCLPNACEVVDDDHEPSGEYVLWVGRLNETQKRPHLLPEVAKQFPDEEFVVIGPKGDSEYAREVTADFDATPNVTYLGPVDPEDIFEHYTESKLVLSTSKYEGFPNVFLEAWAHKVPVVSLSIDPNRFVEGIDHQVCADGELTEFRTIVADLLEDPSKRTAIATDYYDFVRETYSVDAIAEAYGDVIQRARTESRLTFSTL